MLFARLRFMNTIERTQNDESFRVSAIGICLGSKAFMLLSSSMKAAVQPKWQVVSAMT